MTLTLFTAEAPVVVTQSKVARPFVTLFSVVAEKNALGKETAFVEGSQLLGDCSDCVHPEGGKTLLSKSMHA